MGSAFALELAPTGAPLVLWSRHAERATALRDRIGASDHVAAVSSLEEVLGGADVALLSVTDDALGEMALRCAAASPRSPGQGPAPVALHHAGYHGPEVLDPLASAGWATGKLHPLAAMPPGEVKSGMMRGAWFAVGGAPRARRAAARLVGWLGGHELVLAEGEDVSRTYHAAAALLAGGVVALMDASEEAFAACLEDPSRARPALATLLESAIRPLAELGAARSLAGPVTRGSLAVVAGHLEALRAAGPGLARLYALLAIRMAALAEERGSIDAERRAALERLLRAE